MLFSFSFNIIKVMLRLTISIRSGEECAAQLVQTHEGYPIFAWNRLEPWTCCICLSDHTVS